MTNDWIEWRGGPCPVDKDATVEIKCRDESFMIGRGDTLAWNHNSGKGDITAFRFADNYKGDRTVVWKSQNYCPVPSDTVVEIELESGSAFAITARSLNWNNQNYNSIVAFRIVETEDVKEEQEVANPPAPSRTNDVLWGSW